MRTFGLFLLLGLAACSGDDAPDAGPDADPPADASLPAFYVDWGTCPSGWRSVEVEAARTCEPWAAGVEACPAGEMRVPSSPLCAPVGGPCPPGRFADGLADDGSVVYVDSEASAPGDGSRATPFADLAEALAAVGFGDATIALSKGEHDGGGLSMGIVASVSLVGACPAETIVRVPTDVEGLSLNGALTVAGAHFISPTLMLAAAPLTIERSIVDLSGVEDGSLIAIDADVGITDSLVIGGGLILARGVRVERSELRELTTVAGGFAPEPSTMLVLTDTVLSGHLAGAVSLGVDEVVVPTVARRLVVEGDFSGLFVGPGSDLEDVVIRSGIEGTPGLVFSYMDEGGALPMVEPGRGARISVYNGSGQGIFVEGMAATVTDAVVDTISEGARVPVAVGAGVARGGALELDRFVIRESASCGVQVDGAELDLSNGLVAANSIGACVQVDGYDLGRLMDGVRYHDNDTNLDSTSLPVPDPNPPVAAP